MLTAEIIRQKFIKFFSEKGHRITRSSSLVPHNDPSLLFTNAGMVQFKKIFQGLEQAETNRAVSVQKCLRAGGKHNDLENVGRTARHHTFFEMLGNFSFGDYFKKDAITFAWEFLTKELNLPQESLYATVYNDDDEAFELWKTLTPLKENRIIRLGEKDNFWTMGETGPCGPCSEILIDQGEHLSCGSNCGIGSCDCDRFLEIWNLVFMQFNQTMPGVYEKLPKPSIDTGMGLERITAVCQKVFSNYDIDSIVSIIEFIASLANVKYSKSLPDTNDTDTALRVIADHSRAIAFMIADGIMPSNDGRGYVLRRLLRRAYRFGRTLGLNKPFLYKTTEFVVVSMKSAYPELAANAEFMTRIVKEEEERFERTLDTGLQLLDSSISDVLSKKETLISGETAFKLYDTYGFPLDIVNDIAEKHNLKVDENSFNLCMQKQRELAQAARKNLTDNASKQIASAIESFSSTFCGYEHTKASSKVLLILDENGFKVNRLEFGQKGFIITETTPFYGTSGGQVGDIGIISNSNGVASVTETTCPSSQITLHHVLITEGFIEDLAEVSLNIDVENRLSTTRNHTAAHLLHSALQKVLGSHVKQAGSLVSADRLRFDFTHISAIEKEDIKLIENRVNRAIMDNITVKSGSYSYNEAIELGALALFGEKYGDVVRVIKVDPVSIELCGGTHVNSTGEIGPFVIISESGISAGTRRIEALTGWKALAHYSELNATINDIAKSLKAPVNDISLKIESLQTELKNERKKVESLQSQSLSFTASSLIEHSKKINEIDFIAAKANISSAKLLRELLETIKNKINSGIVCLSFEDNNKINVVLYVSKNLQSKFSASDLIKQVMNLIEGSGGGKADTAQAGGTNPKGIDALFVELENIIRNSLN